MTIQEMHIGIDLGLQQMDSKLNTNLLHEEKDYFINITISDFINAVFNNEKNTTFNFVSAQDIKQYYNALQKFIRNADLKLNDLNDYYESELPSSNSLSDSYKAGKLITGVRYKITAAGSTDLSTFGYSKTTNVVGNEFECKINEVNLVDGQTLQVGVYKILNAGGYDYTVLGATDSNINTIFAIDAEATIDLSSTPTATAVLLPIEMAPSWDGTTTLSPIQDNACYLPLSSTSIISIGDSIMSGSLVKREKYIVSNPGNTPIDLSGVGGVKIPDVGYIFTCTSDVDLIWTDNATIHKVTSVANRIVIFEEVHNYLNNRFGSIKTSPITVYANDNIRIYHGNKFVIYNAKLSYIVQPVKVNYNDSIDSDLPEYLHSFIMDLVVKRISATIGSREYSALDREIITNKQISPNAV